jgi:hypothetical protein
MLDETANPKMRLAAARGIVPGLKPAEIVTLLVAFAAGPSDEVSHTARQTLASLPPPVLKGALSSDLPAAVIDDLAHAYGQQSELVAQLLRMPRLSIDTVLWLAQHGNEAITELVATNQERLIAHPRLMELLYLNDHTRMSTADRLVEFAVRSGIELRGIPAWAEVARAIEGELIPEPADEPLPDDIEYREAVELANRLTDDSIVDPFLEDEEGEEKLDEKYVPLYKAIGDMTVSQKIRRAMLGTKEERALLVRDRNRLVSAAAIRSPRIQEPEVVQIAHNRNVSEDVLRVIGNAGEWIKSYQIKKNLVENPRTPIAIAQKLVIQLRESDLTKLTRNKNVSGAIRQAARRHLQRRKT